MTEPNLFSHKAKEEINKLFVNKTQRIVFDYRVVINGYEHDAVDVYDTLQETCEGGGKYISNEKLAKDLKALGVIDHPGSYHNAMSAQKGPNYDYFMKTLARLISRVAKA